MDIGEKIGLLIIKDKIKQGRRWYYLCQCKSGNEKLIRCDSFSKKNPTLSCGCLRKETQFKRKDITGIKYGRLTAIEYTGKGRAQGEIWKCVCECGNIVERTKDSLVNNNNIVSCGCRTQEMYRENAKLANKKLKETDWIEGTAISKITREKLLKNNTSGVTGVSWCSSRKKWVAQIEFKGKHYSLGRYEDKEKAIEIRKEAEEKLFGEFLEWYNSRKKK